MKPSTINKLCCPFDTSDLELTIISKDVEGDILEGFLFCKACKRIYTVVSGIPIMAPDEYREFELEQPLLQRWTKDKVTDHFRALGSETELTG